ncbi:hypothetical protein PRZ48_014309 [Zasmidium cellare]|uniref:Uncharacterized protein n=1 Tax=Zasmidium cellare TaxID=395010 RepID=A0ABR0E1B7_ZASCE|nr:hypothetical protein PRZ48_014309 [Zasmidium cellare]
MDESTIASLLYTAELCRVLGAVIGVLVGFAIIGLLAHFKIAYPGHRDPLWLITLTGGIGYSIFEILTYTTFNVLPNTCAAAKEILSREEVGFAYPCEREVLEKVFLRFAGRTSSVAAWEVLAARWILIAILAVFGIYFVVWGVLGFLFAVSFVANGFKWVERDVSEDAEKGEGEWGLDEEEEDWGCGGGEGSVFLY